MTQNALDWCIGIAAAIILTGVVIAVGVISGHLPF